MTTAPSQRTATVEIRELLDPHSVATDCACVDAADALRQAAELLVRVGAVTADYADAAIAREIEYPTGLPTQPFGVALPHADNGVLRPAISLLTLHTPVVFGEMGTGEPRVPVRLVLMLAFPPGDAHVQAIGALAEMLQQPEFVAEALRATAPEVMYATFQQWASRSTGKE